MSSAQNFSAEEQAQLKKAFDTFDEDRSNTIDANELTKILALLGRNADPAEVERLIASVDKTGTGVITYEDFLHLMWRRKKEKIALENYRRAFRAFTQNATEKMNASELRQLMMQLGYPLDDEGADEMLFEADEDEDQHLSFDEFLAVIQRAKTEGMKGPLRRGWVPEHNHPMEGWIKVGENIESVLQQSAIAKRCTRPTRMFRSVNYPKATTIVETGKNVQGTLSQARDGDTIVLPDNKYTEPFVIHHDGMTVRSDLKMDEKGDFDGTPSEWVKKRAGAVVIEVNSKQPAITIKTRYAKLENVTVINHDGPAIAVEQGYCDIEGCIIKGGTAGLVVRNRSFPLVANCDISDVKHGPGIQLKESRAIVEGTIFRHCYDGAVVAERSCNPWITNCVVQEGNGSGLVFVDGALGIVANTQILANGTQGAYLDSSSNAVFWRCNFENGKANGIKMLGSARATIEECTFANNADHDLEVVTEANPVVHTCNFKGGSGVSVSVKSRGAIALEGCEFGSYPLTAVQITDSRAIIIANKFRCENDDKSLRNGLVVNGASVGRAIDNEFVGWKPGFHEGRTAMQFAESPGFKIDNNVVQPTAESAEAENIVNLLGGGLMRRKSIRM